MLEFFRLVQLIFKILAIVQPIIKMLEESGVSRVAAENLTLKAITAPHAMTSDEEKLWMDRASKVDG